VPDGTPARDGLLAEVQEVEGARFFRGPLPWREWPASAGGVSIACTLDLGDIRTVGGEHLAGERSSNAARQFDDMQAGKGHRMRMFWAVYHSIPSLPASSNNPRALNNRHVYHLPVQVN
jgi:hypothetical protein